jgi:hypothetical protein
MTENHPPSTIPEKTLAYFDAGVWCRGSLGMAPPRPSAPTYVSPNRSNGAWTGRPPLPRCLGGSLNLALTDGRTTSWQRDPRSLTWYLRLAQVLAEQFPEFDIEDRQLRWAPTAAIECINDNYGTRESMRACLEKLAATYPASDSG